MSLKTRKLTDLQWESQKDKEEFMSMYYEMCRKHGIVPTQHVHFNPELIERTLAEKKDVSNIKPEQIWLR